MNRLKEAVISTLKLLLPARIKNSLLHASYHLAPTAFERFVHIYCIGPSMSVGLQSLADRGFSPSTIVDVGAYEGSWSITAHKVWPSSRIVIIEPNHAKKPKLSKLAADMGGKFYDDLLGASCGTIVEFNLMETGSSIMSEISSVERVVEMRTLTTLDSLRLELNGASNLLKIDAQGYELEILKGATASLRSFEAVLLEIAIIEINKGAPLLHEVTAFMAEIGFVASEILEMHRRPLDNALSQIDVMFVRKESPILSDLRYSE